MNDPEFTAPVEHLVGEQLVHDRRITLRRAIGSVGVGYQTMAELQVPLGRKGVYIEPLWMLREWPTLGTDKAPRLHVLNEHGFDLVREGMNVNEAAEKWRSYGEIGLMYLMGPVQLFRRGKICNVPRGYEKPVQRPQVWVAIDSQGRVGVQDATSCGTKVFADWAGTYMTKTEPMPTLAEVDRYRHLHVVSSSETTSEMLD